MTSHDPIAYTYDADTHCPPCAEARFGRCRDGWIACPDGHRGLPAAMDSEGNTVGVIAPWDEWCDPDAPGEQALVCGTCGGVVREHEHEPVPAAETCDTCPFTSSDPDAIRGHEAGPSTGRGWFGQGERHTMSKPVPAALAGDAAWEWRTHVDGADFAASPAKHEEYDRWLSRERPGDPPAYHEGE